MQKTQYGVNATPPLTATPALVMLAECKPYVACARNQVDQAYLKDAALFPCCCAAAVSGSIH
eukprot:8274913-Pyramimonas_sp.AAC.1